MAVVVMVGDHHPEFMQSRCPLQLASLVGGCVGRNRLVERFGHGHDTLRLGFVDRKTGLHFHHGSITHVTSFSQGGFGLPLRLKPLLQVKNHALTQRPFGRQELINAEVHRQGIENGHASADDLPAIVFEAWQSQFVHAPRLQALGDQPAQAVGCDAAVGDPAGGQYLRHRTCGSRGAQRFFPQRRGKGLKAFFQLRTSGNLRTPECGFGETSVVKVLHGQTDAADLEGLCC